MKSKNYKICFGTVPGYNVDNSLSENFEDVSKQIQNFIEYFHKKTGVYISGTLEPTKIIYSIGFGAPIGGEEGYNFNISFNPEFTSQSDKELDELVCNFAKLIKDYYKQATITVEKFNTNFFYLKS